MNSKLIVIISCFILVVGVVFAGYGSFEESIAKLRTATLTVDETLQVGSTGTAFGDISTHTVTIASGATSATLTLDTISATDKVLGATIVNSTTTKVAVSNVIPAAGSMVVHVTGNPGASGATITVVLAE